MACGLGLLDLPGHLVAACLQPVTVTERLAVLPLVSKRLRDVSRDRAVWAAVSADLKAESEAAGRICQLTPTGAVRVVIRALGRWRRAVRRLELKECTLDGTVAGIGVGVVDALADAAVSAEAVATVTSLAALEHLTLRDVTTRGLDLQPLDLTAFGKLAQLRELNVHFSSRMASGDNVLLPRALGELRQLRRVSVLHREWTSPAEHLRCTVEGGGLLACAALEEVDLRGCAIDDPALDLSALNKLRVLRLNIGRQTCPPASVAELPCLRVLEINSCFELCAVQRLDGVVGFAALEELDLARTQLRALPAGVVGIPRLRVLSLAQNPHLHELPADLADMRCLERVDLRGCGFSAVPEVLRALSVAVDADVPARA